MGSEMCIRDRVLRLIKGKAVADISVKVINHGKPLINKKVAEELGIPMSQHLLDTVSFVE